MEERCLAATDPNDLSDLWVELDAAKTQLQSNRDAEVEVAEKLAAAVSFVGAWRNYLVAYHSGNRQIATELLGSLLTDHSWLTLVSRSKVLDRYREKLDFYAVEYPTGTIEDLPKVIAAFKKAALVVDQPGRLLVNDITYDLDPGALLRIAESYAGLQQVWESRTEQDWDRIVKACQVYLGDHRDIVRFKLLILPWALAGYLNLPEAYYFDPSPGMTAAQHLDSIIDLATSNKDLTTLWRAMSYRSTLSPKGPEFAAEQKAVDLCLTGQEMEAIGAMERAVAAYIEALSGPARGVPIDFATKRFSEFRKSYPQAYQIGIHRKMLAGVRKPTAKPWNHKKVWTKH